MTVQEFQGEVEAALRGRAPALGVRRILGLSRFPGGLSSESWRLEVETERGAADWVLRKEPAVGIIEPSDIVKGYEVISALHDVGLAVPQPLHVERRDVLGTRFMVMSFVDGAASPFGMACPGAGGTIGAALVSGMPAGATAAEASG